MFFITAYFSDIHAVAVGCNYKVYHFSSSPIAMLASFLHSLKAERIFILYSSQNHSSGRGIWITRMQTCIEINPLDSSELILSSAVRDTCVAIIQRDVSAIAIHPLCLQATARLRVRRPEDKIDDCCSTLRILCIHASLSAKVSIKYIAAHMRLDSTSARSDNFPLYRSRCANFEISRTGDDGLVFFASGMETRLSNVFCYRTLATSIETSNFIVKFSFWTHREVLLRVNRDEIRYF